MRYQSLPDATGDSSDIRMTLVAQVILRPVELLNLHVITRFQVHTITWITRQYQNLGPSNIAVATGKW